MFVSACRFEQGWVISLPCPPSDRGTLFTPSLPPADFAALTQQRADSHSECVFFNAQQAEGRSVLKAKYLPWPISKGSQQSSAKCVFSDPALLSLQNIMGLFTHPCDMFHCSIIYERSFIVGPILSRWGFSTDFIIFSLCLYVERMNKRT